jgi:iron-only hydrogenase group A
VVQTAPAVRAALGEEFGMPIGTNAKGKMVTALKRIGFDKVFDTNTGADFTIMEEANEFIERVQENGVLPMITSCSPGWVRFAEKNYGDLLGHLSSCKSPHQMFGAIIKSYFAEKYGIDRNKICTVSVMPCIAKKYECSRPEMEVDGARDVDYVITTRELARMIKQANINFVELEDSEFDNPMGEATGAGAIFGTTGGVMEAAIRTAVDTLENKNVERLEYTEVRGEKGIKETTLNVAGKEIKIAVASGLANARKIMDEIRAGKSPYHFIEIMACPGGCVMGGGQPIKNSRTRATVDVRKLRADVLYSIDDKSQIRKSHENPVIKQIYSEYLEKPGSHLAHKYLHTTYNEKNKYDI